MKLQDIKILVTDLEAVNMDDTIKQLIDYSLVDEPSPCYSSGVKDGESYTNVYCTCGTKYVINGMDPVVYMCPTCGRRSHKTSLVSLDGGYNTVSNGQITQVFDLRLIDNPPELVLNAPVIEDGGVDIYAVVQTRQKNILHEDGDTWTLQRKIVDHVVAYAAYHHKLGWFESRSRYFVERPAALRADPKYYVTGAFCKGVNFDITERNKAYIRKVAEAEAKKVTRKPSVSKVDMLLEKELSDIPSEECQIALVKLKNKSGNVSEYYQYCPHCHQITTDVIATPKYNPGLFLKFTCPTCGATNAAAEIPLNSKMYKDFLYGEEMDGNLIIRVVRTDFNLGACGVYMNRNEESRFYLTPKQTVFMTKPYDGSREAKFVKERIPSLWSYNQAIVTDSLEPALRASWLGNTGIFEMDASPYKIGRGVEPLVTWARQYRKYPCVEQLAKAGFYKLVVSDKSGLNANGKSPKEIIGVDNFVLKIAKERRLAMMDIKRIQGLRDRDPSLDRQMLDKLNEFGIGDRNSYILNDLLDKYGLRLRDIISYLQRVLDYQCIEPNDAIQIWWDYLQMADDMHYDLSDKSVRYPTSLKKVHDIAIFAFRAVQQTIQQKRFAENAERFTQQYTYELKDETVPYVVRIPQTPEDIVSEGNTLCHCVSSYVQRMQEGRTCIAFVREKDNPDRSFYTIEIRDDAVVQLRGYCNCTATPGVREFVKRFAQVKHLRMAC